MDDFKPVFNYSKLEGRIKEKFNTQKNIAEHLSFGNTSLSQKLNNRVAFSQADILEVAKVLDISGEEISEYFFEVIVRITEQEKLTK